MASVLPRKNRARTVRGSEFIQFRRLFELATDSLCIFNPDDGRVRLANPAFRHLLDLPDEPNPEANVFELVHPDDLPRVRENLAEVVRTGRGGPYETRVSSRRGRIVPLRWNASFASDENLIYAVGSDVSVEIAARNRAAAEERRLHAFLNHTPTAIAIKDSAGRYVYINPAAAATPGWATSMLGKTDAEIWPAHADQLRRHDVEVIRTHTPRVFEEAVASDGETRHFLSSKFGLDGEGTETAVVALDVTALRETEERLRLVREATGLVLLERDLEAGTIEFIGDTAALFGEEIHRCAFSSYFARIPPGDRERIARERAEAMARGQSRQDLTHRITRSDGSIRWVDVRLAMKPGTSAGAARVLGVMLDVTEKYRTEEELRSIGARLRLAQEATGLVVMETNLRTGQCEFFGDTNALFGTALPPRSLREFVALIPADDVERIKTAAAEFRQRRAPRCEFQHRIKRPDGSVRWVVAQIAPTWDADEPSGYVGVLLDVTDSRVSEQAIELARDAAGVATWAWDFSGNRLHGSGNLAKIYATATPPASIEEMLQRVHPEDRDALREKLAAARSGRLERGSFDYRIRRDDGSVRWLRALGQVEHDAHGVPSLVRGVTLDITEQYAAETRLRDSEARYRGLFDASMDGIAIIDPSDMRIVEANRAMTQMYGYADGAMTGTDIRNYSAEPQASVDAVLDPRVIHATRRHRRKDGIVFPVDISFGRFMVGNRALVACAIRDTTGPERAAQALRMSELKFRQLADTAPVLIWMCDPQRRDTYLNRHWREYTTESSTPHIDWPALLHPDDYRPTMARFSADFAARRPCVVEYRMRRRDGQYRHLVEHGVPRFTEDGEFIGYIGTCTDITERVQAEQSLRASERKYRLLLEQIHDGVLVSQDERFVFCNTAVAKMLDYAPDELIGLHFQDVVAPEFLPLWTERFRQRVAGRNPPSRYELRLLRRGGSGSVWVSVHAQLSEFNGRPAVLNSLRDITEQRQTLQALQESIATLQATLEATADGIFVVDENWRVVAHNRKYRDLWGITDEEILTDIERVIDHVTNKVRDPQLYRRMIEELRAQPSAVVWDQLALTDGRTVERYSQPQFRDGAPAGRAWSFRDVSARVESERRLRMTQTALDRATDAVCFVDAGGCFLYVNAALCRQFQFTEKELLGQRFDSLGIVLAGARYDDLWQRVKEHGSQRFDATWPRGDGAVTTVEIYGHYLNFNGTEFACLFLRDVSERRLAEDKLRRAAAELSLAEERERKELARALHDNIVQDLGLMKLWLAELPCPRGARAATYQRLRELMDKAVGEARSLLFEISPPVLYDLGLTAALEWLGERFEHTTGVTCAVGAAPGINRLSTDRQVLLFQCARELLVNIRKHAQARSVELRCRENQGRCVLTVTDDGVGFDATTALNRHGDSSFGLYSIRDRLDLIGGELRIDSKPGTGTRARITIPMP